MEKISELEVAIAALEKAMANIDLEIMRLASKFPNPVKRVGDVDVFDPFKKVKSNGRGKNAGRALLQQLGVDKARAVRLFLFHD